MSLEEFRTRSQKKASRKMRRITQRSGTSCGVACLAMLSRLTFTNVFEAGKELWGSDCWDDGHRTSIEELRELLGALGWKLGNKVAATNWEKVPTQSLVAIQFIEEKETWHWVVTDEDEEGLFVLDPRASVKREKRRDLNRMSLAWYHRVTKRR